MFIQQTLGMWNLLATDSTFELKKSLVHVDLYENQITKYDAFI